MATPDDMSAMRVALPVFGNGIAPRFCFAREVLVVDLAGGRETGRRYVMFGPEHGPQRIRTLRDHGVRVLLCSGFNRHLLPLAQQSGIDVVWGLQGEVDNLIRSYQKGDLEPQPGPGRAFQRRRRRRFKRGGRK
jgi:predicted Fe-Mo cluster-binding NifX family protein